ncbi:MAG: hypothetical protein KatS3mg131_3894 [Candidatus Tectimicrobiota bacterium]|nr:MAG: hypothetical protein KatS3mg131_3894 [Candidatus Tectomicrobia bacterium]
MWQRRKFPRLRREYRLRYEVVDSQALAQHPLSSFAVNISGGGICFEAASALPKGSVLTLEIEAPDFGAPIVALARVVWCRPRGAHHEVGAEFWWIGWRDASVQAALADFVTRHTVGKETAA